jgi:anaerobic magnesium-protoporphyrin IX monomethyl ester cyclase
LRVLFLYSDIGTYLPRHYQHGIGFLSAVLKAAGHETTLIYPQETPEPETLIADVDRFRPDLVAISAGTNQFHHLRRFAEWIRKAHPDLPIICGGIHATLAPEEVLRVPAIDFICLGECEEAMLEFVEALSHDRDPAGIANLWLKQKDKIIRNPVRPLQENLDALPFADREIFDHENLLAQDYYKLSLLVARGCPFRCTYCSNYGKRELYRGKGKFVRLRSVDNILAEVRAILSRYRVDKLDFNDDIFTLNRAWVEEFCEAYPGEFSIPFDTNVHIETLDRAIIEKIKAAGCDMIRIGVESGSERVRRDILNRPMSQEKIIQVFRDADEVGLRTWSFNMVGLPGETPEDAELTYRLNEQLWPDHMQVSVFNPYPGTELYRICKEKGYLSAREVDGYFIPESVLEMPQFSREQIYEWHRRLIHLSDVSKNDKRLRRELGERGRQIDLIDSLDKAEIETPLPTYVGEDYFTIGEDVRRVLLEHPPSCVRFKLRVPGKAKLRFGIAMHPGVLEKPGGQGVIFTIRAGLLKRRMKMVFEQTLDAKKETGQRGWHDFEIPLDFLSGKKVFIEFITNTRDPQHTDFNTAGWSNPIILGEA